ncbi:MAG: ABC transporter permease, partial [Thermoleophilaceae bacterium]|nr:ABC transporter permease [Thermoleophilaceae bacterium]
MWLLVKDLRVLKRSPLLVAMLVLYPVIVAVLIGFALSRGPEKPEVAFYNGVPRSENRFDLGGTSINLSDQADVLFKAIDPVRVGSREEAVRLVRSGDVLGAIVIPEDITQKLRTGIASGTIEVYYNAEDPAKRQYVENTIRSQVQTANAALTRRIAGEAVSLLELIRSGGRYRFLGEDIDVLGLQRSARILREARSGLPPGRLRTRVDEVIRFAGLAQENLTFSDEVLGAVGEPIKVRSEVVKGGSTSLSSFAIALAVTVTLMFITVLLAAGVLASEREENAFGRLMRGLVSPTALLAEKAALAAMCSLVVALVMVAGLGLFVDLDWGRAPLWVLAAAFGALGFAALGLAIGALAREVRAASLLAFMLGLPLAFLALVPSGAVAPVLYDAIRGVSAAFPFRPSLSAMDAALNGAGSLAGPLVHLAVLTLA